MSKLAQMALDAVTDWNNTPAADIASRIGVSAATLKAYAEERGIALIFKRRGRHKITDEQYREKYLTKYDWGMTDSDLGRQHGMSRELFRQIRRKLGLSPSNGSAGRSSHLSTAAESLTDEDWGMDNKALAEKLNCCTGSVVALRKKYGKRNSRRHDWSKIGLSMTAKEVSELTGCHIMTAYRKLAKERVAKMG
ncbi:MAG: hypothetical protein E6Q97_23810 [Desulfurellales bacterium]|nr:MAG: hypothetical protein E6Q97_23810 [Desulfurellales bacterium]